MTDLCGTCQANTAKLQRSVNLPDEEKSACVKAQEGRLARAKTPKRLSTLYDNISILQKAVDRVDPHQRET